MLKAACLSAALIGTAALASGCAPAFEEQFPEAFEEYQAAPKHKALAFARDGNGGHAHGYGSGHATKQAAIERAMLECSARQKAYQVEGECEIYMVDERKVEE